MANRYLVALCPTSGAPGIRAALTSLTVNLLKRRGNDLLTRRLDDLRAAVRAVKAAYPFTIHAWVVLPDHLHCALELPPHDIGFALRWRLIHG